MYLIGWMVYELPERLFMGHTVVRAVAPTRAPSSMETEVPSMSMQELTSAEHRSSVISIFAQQPMSNHQELIIESCRKVIQSGWASDFLTEEKCMSCSRRAGALRLLLFTSRHGASC